MGFEDLFKKKGKTPEKPPDAVQEDAAHALEDAKRRSAFYRKIVQRYAALVNENEEKTVPELKALIKADDATVAQLKAAILEEVEAENKRNAPGAQTPYVFQTDFLRAAEKAFRAVQQMHNLHSDLPVLFWLTPSEMEELGAGDLFDKALLLCSLLHALGGPARVRVLELEKNRIHPVVVFRFEDRDYLLDASQPESALTSFVGALDDVLKEFSFDGNKCLKSAYEFSDADYQEFGND